MRPPLTLHRYPLREKAVKRKANFEQGKKLSGRGRELIGRKLQRRVNKAGKRDACSGVEDNMLNSKKPQSINVLVVFNNGGDSTYDIIGDS